VVEDLKAEESLQLAKRLGCHGNAREPYKNNMSACTDAIRTSQEAKQFSAVV
jgi:hypothetical protein